MRLLKEAATSAKANDHRLLLRWVAICSLIVVVTLSGRALAWSEAGHIAIAELAVRQLPASERRTLNELSQRLVERASLSDVQDRHSAPSAVATTAAWLDQLRGQTLKEVFARYGEQLPEPLQAYAGDTTDDWHYSNRLFRDDTGARNAEAECRGINSGELNSVLPLLMDAYGAAAEPEDKAIVLAMLVHLVGDAHQPLHSVTRVTDDCEHDRGGNGFCLLAEENDRCQRNLHQAWDAGFGLFQRTGLEKNIEVLKGEAVGTAAATVKSSAETTLQPSRWQSENWALAADVYDTPEDEWPTAAYQDWARDTARQRADLAAARLYEVLRELTAGEPEK